ncbi:RcpB protein [Aggregatibacter actinomycetemcomitans]|uniref:RcpB protein n=1 Tax=Aggregatibacter actinomycetemcomitans TaxID=714 RepID=UPI003989AFA1
MRKLVITASIALASITAPVTTFAISEFVNDTTVAQPVQNSEFNRTQLVDRYVLPDYSNVSYSNLFNSVIRDIGSNNQKQINIIWRDATAKKAAMKIRTKLIKNGIASKSIYLEKKAHKAKTYPIYRACKFWFYDSRNGKFLNYCCQISGKYNCVRWYRIR